MMVVNRIILVLVLMFALSNSVYAKKYKPINEIPDQVPGSEEEQAIWDIGIAHQNKVRGTDEVVNNAALESYLEGIAKRLLGDMVDTVGELDVMVFKDSSVNAWVYPNGTIAVQTGLIAAMKNEAQLAAIIAHEVSHFLNRHAFIQIKSKQKQSAIGKGLGILATAAVAAKTGNVNTGLLNSGQIWTDLVTSGYSRKLETAADKQGLEMLINAGYPVDEVLIAFEQLRIKDDDVISVSKVWSSHPDIDSRKKNLSKQIKKAKAGPSDLGVDEAAYLKAVDLAVLANSQLLVNSRKYDAAIESLNYFVDILPNDARAHYFLGEAKRKKNPHGSFSGRIASYQKALEADPNLDAPYRELGMTYRQQGEAEKAKQAYKTYLQMSPNALDAPLIKWYHDNIDATKSAVLN